MLILAIVSLAVWLIVLALPWRPWLCAERLEPDADGDPHMDGVTVLIPARNEAAVIGETLRALAADAPDARVIVIDDQSDDDTAAVARNSGLRNPTVLRGSPPPPDWTGKLWALQQGLEHADTPWLLLLDADIRLARGMLAALQRKARDGHAMVSVCAEPDWEGSAARWLMPAFAHFFKLLYPFALANREGSRVAAAAGGVILIEREALIAADGFAAWRGAIIDDCALAAHVKRAGHRCFIGLTRGATSLRRANLADIVRMIARSAFVQLRGSWWLLVAVSALLIVAFWIPVLAMFSGSPVVQLAGMLAWLALGVCYLPTLLYYRRNPLAAIALPVTATVFLFATWFSALRTLAGTRSEWKGRRYRRGMT